MGSTSVVDKTGKIQVIPGASDKRCLLRLSELSRCFKVGRRENATLSEYLREAWDGEPIHLPNRKGNALSTTGYGVSVFGDITPGVVRKMVEGGTEGFDGFANRFLWASVRSDKDLPSGGNVKVLTPYLERLADALAHAKQAGELKRNAEAESLWEIVYGTLKRSGDGVPHTDRARPYVVRLSLLYALVDCSPVITKAHLQAALAVWSYCRASALQVFGSGSTEAEGSAEPLWLKVLNLIGETPGVSRKETYSAFGNHLKAEDLDGALDYLERNRLAFAVKVVAEGGGRPAERWYPGEGSKVDTHHPTFPPFAAASYLTNPEAEPEPQADACELASYLTNSAEPETGIPAVVVTNSEPGVSSLARVTPTMEVAGGVGCVNLDAEDLEFIAELEAVDLDSPPWNPEPWLADFRGPG